MSTIVRLLRWLLPIGFFVWVGWHLGLIRYWLFLAIMIGWVVYVSRSVDPTLFRERFKPAGPTIDRYALRAIRATAAASLAVTLTDIDQFHWSDDVPPMVRAAGMIILIVSLALLAQSMIANRFFSTAIRLQTDRGHRVVDIGPYRYVRHPGYVAMAIVTPAIALALGSPGRRPPRCAGGRVMPMAEHRCPATPPATSAATSTAPGSLPRRAFVVISHADAALTKTLVASSPIAARAFRERRRLPSSHH